VDFAGSRTAARTFIGMPFIAASYANVATHPDAVSGAGLTGASLGLAGFVPELRRFTEYVVPLMRW